MNLVEQAVFTSAETDRTAGYQLVAASAGVSDDDCRVLSTWGPSHGSLLKAGRQASSVNFHPLPSGNYCVSRTTAAGNEYSGRGPRVYTQCLVVTPETFGHFANNPFSIVRAASGSGLLKQYEKVPKGLESVPLVGSSPSLDSSLLARARREFGARPIACIVQAALGGTPMAITGTTSGELAIAALLNCLPPQSRPEFSFSTGLRASARRPFRLVALENDAEERRRARQVPDLALIDLAAENGSQFPPADPWARAILLVLETGRTSLLSRFYGKPSPELSLAQLNAMGQELLEAIEKSAVSPQRAARSAADRGGPVPGAPRPDATETEDPDESTTPGNHRATRQQAHSAHSRFVKDPSPQPAKEDRLCGPAVDLAVDHPEVLAMLERLDDLVYASIKGDSNSLGQLREIWPRIQGELGHGLLVQSQEQYLRYAIRVWERCVAATGGRPTEQAVNALDVICLLFDGV